MTRRTRVIVRAEILDDAFVGTAERPVDEKVRSHRYLGGLAFSPAARLQGEVLAGWRQYPGGAAQTAPAYSGPTLQAQLQIPFVGNGLTLAAFRDVYYAVAQSETAAGTRRNSFVSSRYSATLGFDLSWDLIARGTVALWRSDYLLPYELDGASFSRIDSLWTVGGALLRRFGARVALGGTVEHSWRATDPLRLYRGDLPVSEADGP
jgi:hypothetical protein